MATHLTDKSILKGAHFILEPPGIHDTFTPEDLTEEQQMIRETVRQFVVNDHAPLADRMENGEHELNRGLLRKLGDLGLLGTHMPEKLGGVEMDTNTNTVITEELGKTGAFSTTFGAHTGIGMLPILYFGTEKQKKTYLPSLMSGEKVACYCLTEPGSGSDALAAKTRADLSPDGSHYLINGQKMWISNAGFADIFIVFAKIDGKDFTAFILEKGMKGLSLAAEEKKLGIKGSSTRQVFFENVAVPTENMLGEKGKGHHIAFNVLNTGRFKIGPAALGGTKSLCDKSITYANERVQFGRKIASFGAIKKKLAEQAINTFAAEAAVYRTSGLIEDYVQHLKSTGKSFAESKLLAAEEYALESSILKVAMTDILNEVASECVQIHGGMGYSEESGAARAFRDARIAMIYEGTNEINRLLMTNLIFKRAMKGQLDFTQRALLLQQQINDNQVVAPTPGNDLEALASLKDVVVILLGALGQLAMKGKINLKEEQQLLLYIADILIDIYLAESLYIRVEKNAEGIDNELKTIHSSVLAVFMNDASFRIHRKAIECIGAFVLPKHQPSFIAAIEQFTSYPVKNMVELKRRVADYLIDANSYVL